MKKTPKALRLTPPDINPKTGHEDGLPDPRPRPEIWREMLASYQVDSTIHLYDIYFRMKMALADLGAIVDVEMERMADKKPKARRRTIR